MMELRAWLKTDHPNTQHLNQLDLKTNGSKRVQIKVMIRFSGFKFSFSAHSERR